MLLRGHTQAILGLSFAPDNGTVMVSGGQDRDLQLWRVFSNDCENYATLRGGHTNGVTQVG